MIDRGECIMSVTGVRPFLVRPPGKVTAGQLSRADDVPSRLRLLASKLVLGTLEADAMPDDAVDYDGFLDAFTMPPDEDQLADVIGNFPPADHDDAGAYLSCAARCWAYLQGRYPVAPERQLLGSVQRPPSEMALTQFEFELLIVDKPLGVFGLVDSGALLAPQVRALAACYPTLHAAIVDAIADRIATEQARSPGYEPPFSMALSTLSGSPHIDPTVTRGLAAASAYKQQAAQQARAQQPRESRMANMLSPPSARADK